MVFFSTLNCYSGKESEKWGANAGFLMSPKNKWEKSEKFNIKKRERKIKKNSNEILESKQNFKTSDRNDC